MRTYSCVLWFLYIQASAVLPSAKDNIHMPSMWDCMNVNLIYVDCEAAWLCCFWKDGSVLSLYLTLWATVRSCSYSLKVLSYTVRVYFKRVIDVKLSPYSCLICSLGLSWQVEALELPGLSQHKTLYKYMEIESAKSVPADYVQARDAAKLCCTK